MKYKKYICMSIVLIIIFFVGIENYAFSLQDKETYTCIHGTSGGSCTVNKGSNISSGTTSIATHGTSGGSCQITK